MNFQNGPMKPNRIKHQSLLGKILLIEDDLPLASLICQYLRQNHCDVVHVSTGEEVGLLINIEQFDVIICDVMLPDTTGFELIASLKKVTNSPVIFLTALGESKDQVYGLEIGALDYIIKPIEPAVLLARIKVQLKASMGNQQHSKLIIEGLVFDERLKELYYRGELIPFTVQEFDVLNILAKKYLEVVPRETLFKEVVGREYDGLDRAVDLIISRLRRRFEEMSLDFMSIRSIRGKGYLFSCE